MNIYLFAFLAMVFWGLAPVFGKICQLKGCNLGGFMKNMDLLLGYFRKANRNLSY